ncbi:MAG: NADH-quinone oxidoreductase subunit NuoN [Methylohalobius crimeensis]
MDLPLTALSPLLCLASTAAVLLLPAAMQRPKAAAIVAALGFILTLALLPIAWGEIPTAVPPLLRIDGYALFIIGLIATAGLAVTALYHDYFRQMNLSDRAELYLLLTIAALGGAVLAAAEHFAALFLGLELMGISIAVLTAYPFSRANLEAGVKYLILSGTASSLLLFGAALVYAGGGKMTFSNLDLSGPGSVGLVMILAGLGFKLSWVPFHLWAADVYEGAPAPIAGFLGSASKSAGMAVMLRLLLESGAYKNEVLTALFLLIACLSILTGNWLALLQTRLKRLLAYSAIAHFGYLLIVPAAASRLSTVFAAEAVQFYLLAYTLAVLIVFGLVSALTTEEKEPDDLGAWRGLFHHRPLAAVLISAALLSLAGLPLTVGFVGKFYLFSAAVGGNLWFPALILLIGSGLGMYYYLRVIYELGCSGKIDQPIALPRTSMAILCLLVLLLVGLGIHPGGIISRVSPLF